MAYTRASISILSAEKDKRSFEFISSRICPPPANVLGAKVVAQRPEDASADRQDRGKICQTTKRWIPRTANADDLVFYKSSLLLNTTQSFAAEFEKLLLMAKKDRIASTSRRITPASARQFHPHAAQVCGFFYHRAVYTCDLCKSQSRRARDTANFRGSFFFAGVVEPVPEVERVPLKKKTRAMSSASEAVKKTPITVRAGSDRITISRSPRRGLTKLAIDGAQHSHDEVRSENHTHKRAPDAGAKAQQERMMAPEARTTLTR
ncbi:unnamed protein product [Trichogramma brassicae]|uniref:Uncharacterized protein n=1 Tax=Trichogramma brassicae TaxID=86971 RepID=A0A6H5INB1_9HYME|nr:unnamed protein product [Trichogramma brassicae]